MGYLVRRIESMNSDLSELRTLAESNELVSSETFTQIGDLHEDVLDAISRQSEITEDQLSALETRLALLDSEIGRALGIAGILHYKGQLAHAKAIETAGRHNLAGNALRGFFGMFGAALAGHAIQIGLQNASERIAQAIENTRTPQFDTTSHEDVLILAVATIGESCPYMTFNFIVDSVRSKYPNLFVDRRAIRESVSALLSAGILVKATRPDGIRVITVNRGHHRFQESMGRVLRALKS